MAPGSDLYDTEQSQPRLITLQSCMCVSNWSHMGAWAEPPKVWSEREKATFRMTLPSLGIGLF